jgi:hypothetical protein
LQFNLQLIKYLWRWRSKSIKPWFTNRHYHFPRLSAERLRHLTFLKRSVSFRILTVHGGDEVLILSVTRKFSFALTGLATVLKIDLITVLKIHVVTSIFENRFEFYML